MKPEAAKTQNHDDAARHARRVGKLYSNVALYLVLIAVFFAINAAMSPGRWWAVWPALGLGLFMLIRVWHVLVTPRFID
jgi:membrane protein YdbS with pleckstrin-like domain